MVLFGTIHRPGPDIGCDMRIQWLFLGGVVQCIACTQVPAGYPAGKVNVSQLSQGVFQVVVPRVEDDGVKYKEPLPFDLLPYEVRNDKFVSIGTAFAISPTRFVTAAHLFAIPLKTSIEHYYLRNASGVPHEIGTVTKFSQYRDLVEFTLIDSPANVVPLDIRKDVKIGELVRTVGNAHGEGVILRDGLLTSLTPEPVDGRWKFLRFSAPASPGNSGGPLVDSQGRALGVVVRKSGAENLNFAVPIDELDKLSSQKSEFWIRDLRFSEDGKQNRVDWTFASPLPASLASLRAAAVASLNDKIVAAMSVMEPVASSSEAYALLSKNIRQSSPPYDNVPVVDGNKQIIRSVGKLKQPSPLGDLYLYYCTAGTEDSKTEFAAACSGFQQSARFDPLAIQ
jgi:hypothetical protein